MGLPRPLRLVGKLGRPARLNAAAAGQLLYITDSNSSRRFLVDFGASLSLIPFRSKAPPDGPRLLGPDGAAIPCWGRVQLPLSFGGHSFQWQFLRAAVSFPILGLDFLAARLGVDQAALRGG